MHARLYKGCGYYLAFSIPCRTFDLDLLNLEEHSSLIKSRYIHTDTMLSLWMDLVLLLDDWMGRDKIFFF